MDKYPCNSEDVVVRKGPWTMEEDFILINYIANHGEGVWNSIAKSAGLKRTGKSCRLRWLNYLRSDVRRGNITPEEQLLIMELHTKLGNKWSKIAKHLPGRTDNEIKNYWRTRVHKQLKQTENIAAQTRHQGQNFSCSMNDQPKLLLSVSGADHALDQSSSSTSNGNDDNYNYVENFHFPNVDQSSDNDWSMEDLWSMNNLLYED